MKFSMIFQAPESNTLLFSDLKKPTKKQIKEARKFAERYFEFDEVVTIDFDMDDGTATVREAP